MEKPRIKLGTVAALIERFIVEMNGLGGKPAVRTLGESHEYMLRRHQREPIGQKIAADLTKADIIEYCRWRRETVCGATVTQDMTYLSGVLKYAGSAWDDCENISDAAIAAARPFLAKHGMISKSQPRDRRPQPEEIERLLAHFGREYSGKGFKRKIDMVAMTLWQLYSARRVGESCGLLWADWNREDHTILVRKMKDPKNRNKQKVVALPNRAQAFLEALWEIRDPAEPRIFPYRKASVSAAYTHAKKALGIVNLRLHDSRRDAGTRLVEDEGYSPSQAILVTGHETVHIFERTYLRQKPELFKLGPKEPTQQKPAVITNIGGLVY